jgi:hypothetical protein
MVATALDLSQIKTDALSSAATFRSLIELGSSDTPTFKGSTLTGGTVTASTPVLDATQTWNDAAVTFTGIKLDVTDTASASDSLLMDLQVGGASKVVIDKNSHVTIGDGVISSSLRFGSAIRSFGTNANGINVTSYGAVTAWFGSQAVSVRNLVFHTNPASRGAESAIFLDNAQELSQRNAANAQSYLIYNTYTDANNYERGFLKWDSNVFKIGTEAAGTGTARTLTIENVAKINGSTSSAADPSTTEYPNDGDHGIHKNTTSGNVFLAYNDGGSSIVKVQLS